MRKEEEEILLKILNPRAGGVYSRTNGTFGKSPRCVTSQTKLPNTSPYVIMLTHIIWLIHEGPLYPSHFLHRLRRFEIISIHTIPTLIRASKWHQQPTKSEYMLCAPQICGYLSRLPNIHSYRDP
jgi:hypothetical protein